MGVYSPNSDNVMNVTTSMAAPTVRSYILANAAGGPLTITLPSAIDNPSLTLRIKKVDSTTNSITITGSQNIDASTSYVLKTTFKYIGLQSDGTQWYITENN